MHSVKTRVFALALIILSLGLIYYNWRELWNEGSYSLKLAAFGPVVLIGGIYLLIFPSKGGKPTNREGKNRWTTSVRNRTSCRIDQLVFDGPGFFRIVRKQL